MLRCQLDSDDEVRDRATYFRMILEQHHSNLNSQFILNGKKHLLKVGQENCKFLYDDVTTSISGLQVSLSSLERSLHTYTLSNCNEPFDIKTVPVAPVVQEQKMNQADGKNILLICY